MINMYYSPWAQVGNNIANMIMMKHFQDQQKKDVGLLANAFNPIPYDTSKTDTNYQFNDITGQGVKNNTTQGLLSSGVLGNTANMASEAMGGYTPNALTSAGLGQGLSLLKPQQQQQTLGSFTNPLDKYSASKPENQMTTTTTTKELGLPDIQKQIRSAWQKKVQADIKGMSAEGARQYMAVARQTLNEQLGQAKDDYNATKIAAYIEKLPPELQNAYTMSKMGIPDTIIKRLFPEQPASVANGSWVRDPNAPGGYRQVGTVEKNRPHVQLANGNIGLINPDGSIQDTGTPFYQKPSSGGSGAVGDDTSFSKQEQAALTRANATINMFHSRYKDPMTGEFRPGYEQDPLYQAYQQAVGIQNQIYGGKMRQGGQEQPQQQAQGGNEVSSKVAAARSRGIPDNQIRAALAQDGMSEAEINAVMGVQQQPARQQPALTDVSRLDDINNNWQF
jgi:hypothetical protein